jgi:hypothetical protein
MSTTTSPDQYIRKCSIVAGNATTGNALDFGEFKCIFTIRRETTATLIPRTHAFLISATRLPSGCRTHLLREHAYTVVLFYGQLAMVRDGLRRASTVETHMGSGAMASPRRYVINCAEGLLKATEIATRLLPAFERIPQDEAFAAP